MNEPHPTPGPQLGPFAALDLARIFFAPSLAYKIARLALGRRSEAGGNPGERDPGFVAATLDLVQPVLRR